MSFEAVRLQSVSPTNPYTFWVRRRDCMQILENQSLKGQRVAFELNGKTSRYKIIEIEQTKEFVRCYWRKDVNQTWIEAINFHTKLTSVSVAASSISPSVSLSKCSKQTKDKNSVCICCKQCVFV